jgi:hypothetical protein
MATFLLLLALISALLSDAVRSFLDHPPIFHSGRDLCSALS